MPLDDGAADRQSHAEAARLRRVKGVEQKGGLGLAEADAGIFDGDDRPRAIVERFEGRADDEPAALGGTSRTASAALTRRLMRTCWSWIRSPMTAGRSAATDSCNAMP